MMNLTRNTIALLVALTMIASAATPIASATFPPLDPNARGDLVVLAAFLGETPASSLARPTATSGSNAMDVAGTCGEPGHCSQISCNDPGCTPNQSPWYKCSPTTLVCEDDHDWYNPFDNDEHTLYECEAGCTNPPPPPPPPPTDPDCTIYHPTSGGCIVEDTCTTEPSTGFAQGIRLPAGIGC